MKKILSMVLAAMIVFGTAAPYAAAADSSAVSAKTSYRSGDTFIEGDLQYKVLDDGTLEVSAASESRAELKEANIPAEVNGMAVTSIKYQAFFNCRNLTSVTIPNSVISIKGYAFQYCTSLTTVTIPESVTSIERTPFSGCESLTSINVDPQNEYYCSADGVLFNKDKTDLLQYPNGKTSESYTIPDSVTNIEPYAVSQCTGLTSVTIPKSVINIGESAFRLCTGLTSINVDSKNERYSSVDGVLFDKDKTTLITYPVGKTDNSYEIPDGVTNIGDNAFCYCTSLETVTIPDSVTSIGDNAFYDCISLTTVTIPDSVTSIGWEAFRGCDLTTITLPDSVNIGAWAFCGCTNLTTVTIPDSVTAIGWDAFRDTPFLENQTEPLKYAGKVVIDCDEEITDVIFKEGTVGISGGAFFNCASLTTVTIPDGVVSIGANAFQNCENLESVTIPDGVTSIGNSTFNGCTNLTSMTIPDGVTSIETSTFDGCTSLTTVTIPDSVINIGPWAFRDCASLTSVAIPGSVTSIEWCAFLGCTSLTTVTILDGVINIETFAFEGCTSLTSVTIPSSVTNIGECAFLYCDNLTDVYYGGSKEQWNSIDIHYYYNINLVKANIHFAGPETLPEGCTLLGVKGEYITQIQESIDRINEIRLEACKEGIISPSTGKPLTEDDYVPIKWSSDLEYIARIRAAEAAFTMDHVRINGESIWGLKGPSNGIGSSGEVLAWNGSKTMLKGIAQWYDEKSDWVNETGEVTGHYTAMIDPNNRYVGLGTFYSEYTLYPNTTAGEFSRSTKELDAARGESTGEIIQPLEVLNENIVYSLSGEDTLYIDAGIISEDYYGNAMTIDGLFLVGESAEKVRWSSSDESVVTVDYGRLTKVSGGSAVITAVLPDGSTLTKHVSYLPVEIALPVLSGENLPEIGNLTASAKDADGNKVTLTITDGILNVSLLLDGKYEFVFAADNCAPRTYDVTVTGGAASGLDDGVKLHLYGDVNGDNKITNSDVLKANASARKTTLLEGYDLSVADINGDGKITNADVLKMNAHARKTTPIW